MIVQQIALGLLPASSSHWLVSHVTHAKLVFFRFDDKNCQLLPCWYANGTIEYYKCFLNKLNEGRSQKKWQANYDAIQKNTEQEKSQTQNQSQDSCCTGSISQDGGPCCQCFPFLLFCCTVGGNESLVAWADTVAHPCCVQATSINPPIISRGSEKHLLPIILT